jgi:hypothetical protein
MAARGKPLFDHGDLEFAESKLAESRSRLTKFRALQDSFITGSDERMQATSLVQEIEVLHQLIDQLCRQVRARTQG